MMSRTIELRGELQRIFKTVTPNVHNELRFDYDDYPYLVYELRELDYNYGKSLLQLEVNILDYGTKTRVVDTLSDTLQDKLNKYYFINDKIQFATYKRNRNTVQEEDKKVRRRRMLFEIQLHELREE